MSSSSSTYIPSTILAYGMGITGYSSEISLIKHSYEILMLCYMSSEEDSYLIYWYSTFLGFHLLGHETPWLSSYRRILMFNKYLLEGKCLCVSKCDQVWPITIVHNIAFITLLFMPMSIFSFIFTSLDFGPKSLKWR